MTIKLNKKTVIFTDLSNKIAKSVLFDIIKKVGSDYKILDYGNKIEITSHIKEFIYAYNKQKGI